MTAPAPVIPLRGRRRAPVAVTRLPGRAPEVDALLDRAAAAARLSQAYLHAAEVTDLYPGQVPAADLSAEIDDALAALLARIGGGR